MLESMINKAVANLTAEDAKVLEMFQARISSYETLEDAIRYDVNCKLGDNYNLSIAPITRTVKDRTDFAFNEDGIFCHIRSLGTKTFEEILNKDIVTTFTKGYRGYKAISVVPLEAINDSVLWKIEDAVAAEINKIIGREILINQRKADWKAEKEAKEKTIAELVGDYSVRIIIDEMKSYGGYFQAIYSFEKEIELETFKSFMKLLGKCVESKVTTLPIQAEKVTFEKLANGLKWHYTWRGEWDD